MFEIFYFRRFDRAAFAYFDRDIPDHAIASHSAPDGITVAVAQQTGSGSPVYYGYDGVWHDRQPQEWTQIEVRADRVKKEREAERTADFINKQDVRIVFSRRGGVEVTTPVASSSGRRAVKMTWDELRLAAAHDDDVGALYRRIESVARENISDTYVAREIRVTA